MSKTKSKKSKIKFRELDMEFVPGGSHFIPILPLRQGSPKIKINWKWLIILSILFIVWMGWPLLSVVFE